VREEKHKANVDATEAKAKELHTRATEHEDLLAGRLQSMVEDLTGSSLALEILA
jgi:hypothetical protein